MIKISCLPVSLFPAFADGSFSLEDWVREARAIGLDGFDVSLMMVKNHTPAYLARIKEAIGILPAVMATTYPDFTHPDALQRKRERDYCLADAALCSQLGIRYLRVLAGQAHPATPRDKGIVWAVENLRQLAEDARPYGVTLLYENHSKPSAWQYVDFSYPIDIFLEILDGLRHSDIRLNFDIGNISSLGLDPLAVLPRLFDSIETIHVSDMKEVGAFAPVAIGTGAVPIKAVFSYLKNRGFKGWLCLEEASNQGLAGIRRAAEFVRSAWDGA